jgi:enoyl-CoA hydratase/carnithine racemase
MTTASALTKPAQIRITRRTPAYWRVTFDNPPLNVMGPEMVRKFQEVINALEADEQVTVVVFDSAVDDYFLNHSDFTAKLEDLTSPPPGPTGLPPWPDFLVRLTRLPVASIALIRGPATGNGSEITLARDMSFASREKAIISQWEVGVGMVAGGGPMARLPHLIGRNRALDPDRQVRHMGHRSDQAARQRRPAAGRRTRCWMGCLHRFTRAACRAEWDQSADGARLPQTRRCRKSARLLPGPNRALGRRPVRFSTP